ncbi:MAG TPA: hypothetical protein VHO71_04885 [Caproiciproducens sp.]|nr:hypothetical protein [Caproiciproducens sp.]
MKKIISAILAIGMSLCVTTSAFAASQPSPSFKSDTGTKLSISVGKTYQVKITSLNGKKPTLVIPGKLFTVKGNGSKGKNYYFVIKAVGKVGSSAGIYINGQKKPSTVATITNIKQSVPKKPAVTVSPKKPILKTKVIPKVASKH